MHGPDRPLTFDGAPITAIIPAAVADAGNLTVTVVALSYAGTLAVTISVDPNLVPDLPVLAAALQAELDALAMAPRSP